MSETKITINGPVGVLQTAEELAKFNLTHKPSWNDALDALVARARELAEPTSDYEGVTVDFHELEEAAKELRK